MKITADDIGLSLGELYDAVIGDHGSHPRNFGPVPEATVSAQGDNPSCGDAIKLEVRFDAAGDKLDAIGFTGAACSICMASTSLMTTKTKGKTRQEALELLADFQGMITSETPERGVPKTLGDLRVLSGVRKFPQRVKCATLGWHALRGCLAETAGGKFSLNNNDGEKF